MNARRSLVVLVFALVLAAGGALFLGHREALRHGFSARERPWAIEAFAARWLRRIATGSEAAQLANPYAATPETLAQGRDHYADHCALCHGDDGSGKTEIGEGLYPPASDLRRPDTQELSDGELFQIIRNGIRFTGMPGWGDDDEHWKVVLFIRHLPDLTPEEIEQMGKASIHRDEAESPPSHHHHHHEQESSH